MGYKALVIEDDPQAVEMISEALTALGHTYDLATCLVEARRLIQTNRYPYALLDGEFPTSSARGTPRVQNAENFLDELAAAKGKEKVKVIVMLDKPANTIELTVEMMRLAANLRDRGATDFIGKPFPTAGRTLDRVIKKVLGLNGAAGSHKAPVSPAGPEAGSSASGTADLEEGEKWLTVTQASELLARDIPGLDPTHARARVSTAAGRDEFRTNGKARRDRRIEPHSFSTWRLKQRDRDLDEADSDEE